MLLGDDIIEQSETLLKEMIALSEHFSANVVALMEVESQEVSKYGIVSEFSSQTAGFINIGGFVEKPNSEVAPSRLAVIGRYILRPEMFDLIDSLEPGVGGEIQLTDALNLAAENQRLAGPVLGIVFKGNRYDTGDRLSYVKTIVSLARHRGDIGDEFTQWLRSLEL